MGRLREGFSGGFSGRVGNVVGAHWKDISYIRSMPQKSKKPRSAKQRAQEERLALASHFLSPIRQVLETGFRHVAGRGTGCNKAITLLITTAIRGAYPYYAIDYPAVRMSMGGAEPAVNFRMGLKNDALHLAWDAAEDPFNAEPADRVVILLFAEEQECYSISEDSLSRACGLQNGHSCAFCRLPAACLDLFRFRTQRTQLGEPLCLAAYARYAAPLQSAGHYPCGKAGQEAAKPYRLSAGLARDQSHAIALQELDVKF